MSNILNPYQREQIEALRMARGYLQTLSAQELQRLKGDVAEYFRFRGDVRSFLNRRFSGICNLTCFHSRRSACCTREGIITFFGDMVANALASDSDALDGLETVLMAENCGFKCIYLAEEGCLWTVKPIVCEMFLCDLSRKTVFDGYPHIREQWENLEERRKSFTWPDRPVLFNNLEKEFIEAGYRSPLMYFHNSPGLLRIKRQWQG